MSSGKTLTEAERKLIQGRIEQLVEQHGSETAVARTIGLSQQVINRIMRGDPAGMDVARAIAKHDKMGVYEFLAGPLPPALAKLLQAEAHRWGEPTKALLRTIGRTRTDLRSANLGYWEALADRFEKDIVAALEAHPPTRKRSADR